MILLSEKEHTKEKATQTDVTMHMTDSCVQMDSSLEKKDITIKSVWCRHDTRQ